MTDSQQQFCLRWNNFQANITSQFEALRDDEDFVDVTFACDGRRLQAHKVVLSACSPYFKELFKTNPCKHPIIFMRDVEFEHLQSLLEFMYAGEVNISQAELPTFLRTAESLQIRGLTDSQSNQHNNEKFSKTNNIHTSNGRGLTSPSFDDERSKTPSPSSPPPLKRLCKRSDSPQNSSPIPAATATAPPPSSGPRSRPVIEPHVQLDCYKDVDVVEPKIELPEYGSDDECSAKPDLNTLPGGFLSLDGGMEVLPSYPGSYSGSGIEGGMPGPSHGSSELNQEQQADLRKLHSLDPRPCPVCNRMYSNLSNLRQHMRLIHNPQSVTCPLCNKPFKTKLYLKRHLVSFHELSVADRQRQEEIYHHHVKVEVQRQAPPSQAQAQGQNQVQGQAQVQTQVQVQGGQGVQPAGGGTNGGSGGGGGILGAGGGGAAGAVGSGGGAGLGSGGALGAGAAGALGSGGSATLGGGPQAQQVDKSILGGPPPRLPPDDGATSTTCKIVESKSRPFQGQVDDDGYSVESVAQISDTKNFVAGVLQQFNTTFH